MRTAEDGGEYDSLPVFATRDKPELRFANWGKSADESVLDQTVVGRALARFHNQTRNGQE